jgi:hypothetical protein
MRVTEHPVNCSLFFTSDAVFYDPYLWGLPNPSGRTENNFWVFEFRRSEHKKYDCYPLLEKHFEFLELESLPLKDFMGADRKRYEQLNQEFLRKLRERRS